MKQTNWAACTNNIIVTIFTSNISYTEDSCHTNCKQFNTHLDTENYIKKKKKIVQLNYGIILLYQSLLIGAHI